MNKKVLIINNEKSLSLSLSLSLFLSRAQVMVEISIMLSSSAIAFSTMLGSQVDKPFTILIKTSSAMKYIELDF